MQKARSNLVLFVVVAECCSLGCHCQSVLTSFVLLDQNGNQLFKCERYQEAADEYTQGLELPLEHPSLVAVLHCNRASALLNLSRCAKVHSDRDTMLSNSFAPDPDSVNSGMQKGAK